MGKSASASDLRVSVVVATRNRPERLARLLDAMESQDFEGEWELVVVDDSSGHQTVKLIEQRGAALGVPAFRAIRTAKRSGPSGARNAGWRASRGDLIAFTDDDCEPCSGWLSAVVGVAMRSGEGFIQGPTMPNPTEVEESGPFTRTVHDESLGPWFPGSNISYPRSVLLHLGGFDESMVRGEDTDLAWRVIESGSPAVYAPDAVVYHGVVDVGPAGRLKVAWNWHSAVRNLKRHPELKRDFLFGCVWKRSHLWLLVALLSAAVFRTHPLSAAAAIPYARDLRRRMKSERARFAYTPYYVIHDSIEVAAMVRGGLEAKVFVL